MLTGRPEYQTRPSDEDWTRPPAAVDVLDRIDPNWRARLGT
jgi:hypothetical protein